ncbi:hypothetical protein FVE85_2564 [Porphyridium purpureum]|uniref:PWWP domain-containing protein n=1 Tax=Porphyridium purpureum TaxID=35688 RepID=A0A5J4YJI6_PORPP|nr:hypothetical protein FVE85_2564 [Porphyridium purpureum]|eukprot:POR7241..scf291_13
MNHYSCPPARQTSGSGDIELDARATREAGQHIDTLDGAERNGQSEDEAGWYARSMAVAGWYGECNYDGRCIEGPVNFDQHHLIRQGVGGRHGHVEMDRRVFPHGEVERCHEGSFGGEQRDPPLHGIRHREFYSPYAGGHQHRLQESARHVENIRASTLREYDRRGVAGWRGERYQPEHLGNGLPDTERQHGGIDATLRRDMASPLSGSSRSVRHLGAGQVEPNAQNLLRALTQAVAALDYTRELHDVLRRLRELERQNEVYARELQAMNVRLDERGRPGFRHSPVLHGSKRGQVSEESDGSDDDEQTNLKVRKLVRDEVANDALSDSDRVRERNVVHVRSERRLIDLSRQTYNRRVSSVRAWLIRCAQAVGISYPELVFAKAGNHPFWPGIVILDSGHVSSEFDQVFIVRTASAKQETRVLVRFFVPLGQDQSYAWVAMHESCIRFSRKLYVESGLRVSAHAQVQNYRDPYPGARVKVDLKASVDQAKRYIVAKNARATVEIGTVV